MFLYTSIKDNPTLATQELRPFLDDVGKDVFPRANDERDGSIGGVFTAWIRPSPNESWRASGVEILVGTVQDLHPRTAAEREKLYRYHANKKCRVITESIDPNIIASSQLADTKHADSHACTYQGSILCDRWPIAYAFSGLPSTWDEVLSLHVAYFHGHISLSRVRAIANISDNDHLRRHFERHFDLKL